VVELTDINLDSFIIRELRGVVAKHPRFRELGGEITSYFSTLMRYNDLEIIIKDPSAQGNRLSSDHFIATQIGRTILAKLEDKDGLFIESMQEIDKTGQTPEPGLYYLNLDSVNEQTRDISLTCEKLRWVQGHVDASTGSYIVINSNFSPYNLVITNMNSGDYRATNNRLYLLKYVDSVNIMDSTSNHILQPMIDYWVEKYDSVLLTSSTILGRQNITIPDLTYITVDVVDQDGYILRPNIDYYFSSPSEIILSDWTPANQTLYLNGYYKRDPRLVSIINPDNIINFGLQVGETLIQDQVLIRANTGDYTYTDLVQSLTGDYYLINLLDVGDSMKWQARVQTPQFTIAAKKNAINYNFLPGLNVIVGDRTVVGDQLCIMVLPQLAETYEIYGSKENISFSIDIKTNDMTTSSELGTMIKQYLLVSARERLEYQGLTIYEISRSTMADVKDESGLTSSHHVILSVQAAADWEVYKPLITGLDHYDITGVSTDITYPGKLQITPRSSAFGVSNFITSYS